MIDLHLHTTASDGLCTPGELVARAAAAGLRALSVTDHDTTAGVAEAAAACASAGITFVTGIEITAVFEKRDVHMLGYFLDPENAPLQSFLDRQRASRVARVAAIADRLASCGAPIDVRPLLADAARQDGRSIGRPQIARALVDARHATDTSDAFDRWLGVGKPGFVSKAGSPPEEVITLVHGAGGLVSLAHPGVTGIDDQIAALVAAGLDAIEAYHSDHDERSRAQYVEVARRYKLLVTGGSDYHGDPAHGLEPGTVSLPAEEWERVSAWPRRS